ncbi:uncharacterized protein LOC131612445 [Vicia villosa]|uniref:uncharacterized protein LOC131612445 n=1 Tax=Vicia villosa TaxID=3911 RepID=UPI00273B5F12|nr:uncharacterized protein LOC131612445 [Vicia villosa]
MSCISLRLPPAKKVWKSFTSKLSSKLHNIRKSKAMKKQRKNKKNTKTTTITTTTTKPQPKFLATKRFRRKKLATVRSVLFSFNKKPAPVYIDKLFKEPCDYVGYLKPQTQPVYKPRTEVVAVKDSSEKKQVVELEGTSRRCEKASASDDDVWESVALGSPQMQGIDERAEEFIVRFRKQMAAQERLARSL